MEEVVQGKGKGGLLSGLTPRVSSLTLSGGNMPALARMWEAARNPQTVENRAEEQSRKCQHQHETGGGTARPKQRLERAGQSPGESSEGARTG